MNLPNVSKAGSGAIGAVAGVLMAAAVFIMPREGYERKVAPDPIGVPTWCYGETEGPIPYGQTFTMAECKDLLVRKLARYDAEMMACVSPKVVLTDERRIAFISFTYNLGSGAFCHSTLLRKLNAGDTRGACDELLKWNRAGGRVLPGLVTRRKDERALCLKGLA